MWKRVLVTSVLVGSVLFACGGKTDGVGHASSSGSGSSGSGSSSGGTGSSSGVTGSSSGVTGSSSGESGSSSGCGPGCRPQCVDIDPASYDRSCNTADDCVYITTGQICQGDCASCGGTPINKDGYAQWSATVAMVDPGTCFCGAPAPLGCVNHVCQAEPPVEIDAGPPDAGACVNIDLSTYDVSCKVDSDCTQITSGEVCDRNCACGGSAVNVDGLSRYQQELQGAGTGPACSCPAFGVPRCIATKCTLCGFDGTPNQCPDAG